MTHFSAHAAPEVASPLVVLLHGLARAPTSLAKMEKSLQHAGYRTCNIGYASTRYTISDLAHQLLPRIQACPLHADQPIHFLTHSMGGIMVRQLHAIAPELPIGRVVMLGPPNQGSEIVDAIGHWPLFRWINGPAGQQLGTTATSVPNQLGAVRFELGIIAGNKPFLEPFTHHFNGPSDGKVSVARTQLEGMQDFLVLPVTHMLMMRDQHVISQSIHFLQTGHFQLTE